MKWQKFIFTPDIELNPEDAPANLTIKGQSPKLIYPFQLRELYPTIPSLDAQTSYQKIRTEFEHINHLLAHQYQLRAGIYMPSKANRDDAISILSILFDPTFYYTKGLWEKLSLRIEKRKNIFQIEDPQPFPLKLASPSKLIHTLVWVDINIKLTIENILLPLNLPTGVIIQTAESALKCYCYLVKQQDYHLASSINFNFSMFLQDRILNLLLGDDLYLSNYQNQKRGLLANTIVLGFLKGLFKPSYRHLCTLSVFTGVIWVSSDEIQEAFLAHQDLTLGQIETWVNSQHTNWGVDDIDLFLSDISQDTPTHIVVILDDNGESIFDIALFQQALEDFRKLQITFVVNRYPISNNISLHTFEFLLKEDYFKRLRKHFEERRATLCIENQVFRSFEITYLQPSTREAIENSNFIYIKGANFFETFQLFKKKRYHSFTVNGKTSILLTGFPEGKGIFVNLPANQPAYTYKMFNQVKTLHDKLLERE